MEILDTILKKKIMSYTERSYIIAGVDLTGFQTDKYEEWKWTDEGERYTCYQTRGKIQLFCIALIN